MGVAGDRLIEGAKEALAVARGEQPAFSINFHGHRYVSQDAADEAILKRIQIERERCAQLVESHTVGSSYPDFLAAQVSLLKTLAAAIRKGEA